MGRLSITFGLLLVQLIIINFLGTLFRLDRAIRADSAGSGGTGVAQRALTSPSFGSGCVLPLIPGVWEDRRKTARLADREPDDHTGGWNESGRRLPAASPGEGTA